MHGHWAGAAWASAVAVRAAALHVALCLGRRVWVDHCVDGVGASLGHLAHARSSCRSSCLFALAHPSLLLGCHAQCACATLGSSCALTEGAYGVVEAAIDHARGDHVAVKRIRAVFDSYVMATRILREIKFNRLLRGHDNLVSLRDVVLPADVRTFHDTYLVFDRMPCDLSRVIQSRKPIGSDNIKFLMFQLLRGLHYFHRAGVLHRDIKPSNLLVNENSLLKICDLGYGCCSASRGVRGRRGMDR